MMTVVAAVNDDEVLSDNLASSPLLSGDTSLIAERGHDSAGKAYNSALQKADTDVIVFAHQDVYLPRNWDKKLTSAIHALEKEGRKWGVIGVIGIDAKGKLLGRTWSTGLNSDIRAERAHPAQAVSIDEVVIVLNRKSGVLFDEELPGYHMYGTDIVQTAIQKGYGTYVINAPVIHNSLPIITFKSDFWAAYRYMQKKWARSLPIQTPVTTITAAGWPLIKMQVKSMLRRDDRGSFVRLSNPTLKARELGYE